MKTDLTLDDYLSGARDTSFRSRLSGCIYVAKQSRVSWYRVGMTKDIARRLREHKAALICSIKTGDMVLLEHLVHKKYARRRVGYGECFALTLKDLKEIRTLDLSLVEERTPGRPPGKSSTANKAATGAAKASNGASVKKKGKR